MKQNLTWTSDTPIVSTSRANHCTDLICFLSKRTENNAVVKIFNWYVTLKVKQILMLVTVQNDINWQFKLKFKFEIFVKKRNSNPVNEYCTPTMIFTNCSWILSKHTYGQNFLKNSLKTKKLSSKKRLWRRAYGISEINYENCFSKY